MAARPGRWDLLQRDADPVPADAEDVRDAARQFQRRADDLHRAHSTLSRLSKLDGWRGEAAETFAEEADDALGDIRKAADKYADAATAVRDFAHDVQAARDRSKAALDLAEEADTAQRANSSDPLDGVDEPTEDQEREARAESGRHDAAVQNASKARRDLEDALDDLDQAAGRAADRISDASEQFDDSLWDDVKGAVRGIADVLVAICEVLEWIAIAIAVVALAIALFATAPIWATIATVVMVAGLVVGAALLITRVALVLSESGKASWSDVAWDAVGLVTAGFGGRAAQVAARDVPLIITRAGNAGRTATPGIARAGLAQNAQNALHIRSAANPLRAWATQEWDTATNALRGAISSAESTLPTWGQRLRVLDSGAATNLTRLRALDDLGIPAVSQHLIDGLRLQQAAINLNYVNTAISMDGGLDKAGGSASGLVKDELDDVAQGLQNLHWRVAVAGR